MEILDYKDRHLLNWLTKRDALHLKRVERNAGVPFMTLQHFVKGRRALPEIHREKILMELANYGYVPMN